MKREMIDIINTSQLIADCEHYRCLIRWDNYPLSGGTKLFCAYWVIELGKPKKIEFSKLKECPKNSNT